MRRHLIVLTNFNVVILIVDVGPLPLPLSRSLALGGCCRFAIGTCAAPVGLFRVVSVSTLLTVLALLPILCCIRVYLLFIRVFVIHSVVEVLVVKLLVVTNQFSHPLMEPDHQIFVGHQPVGLG